jgi:uncharacterized membrane protein
LAWSSDCSRIAAHPVAAFVVLSAIFGTILVAVSPPLRGPDESAHFLRAYGIAQGDLIPSLHDAAGRKGILLPLSLQRDFSLFETWANTNRGDRFNYRRVFDELRNGAMEEAPPIHSFSPQAGSGNVVGGGETVFVPYGGSEGYSPLAYLPQAAAGLLARAAGLGFLETLYLMRLAGLVAMTAVVAYAIALAPALRWSLVAIAMLPSAVYGRAVINADAAAFAYALVVIAIFLRAVLGTRALPAGFRAGWMLLCALSKPPNLVFVLLEWMRVPLGRLRREWRAIAVVTVPAIAAALLWTALSAGNVAAWRLIEFTSATAEEFDPGWKLQFMLAHPFAFPQAVIGMIADKDAAEFWRQVIGVLGLFDTVLLWWIYPVISLLVLASFLCSSSLPR